MSRAAQLGWSVTVLMAIGSSPRAAAGEDRGQAPPAASTQAGPLRIDQTSFALAANTGGDFYFWERGEFASSPTLSIPFEAEAIVLVAGALGATERRTGFEVPVDRGVGQVSFFTGVQGRELLEITTPDGGSALALDQRATVQQTRHMLIVTVPAPQPGLWKVTVGGSGHFMVNARAGRNKVADAPELVEIIGFTFVEIGGRPGHEGWFPTREPPAAGAATACRVTVSGFKGVPWFGFIDGRGETIASLKLERTDPKGDEWLGLCSVPERPYRLCITGTDDEGRRWQRVDAPLRDPHAVRLSPEDVERLLREVRDR